jgi:signal transduction histidine kinase
VRISLPGRIFLLHLAFILLVTVVGGWLVVRVLRDSYRGYAEEWQAEVESFPVENLYLPLAAEVGRTLLLRMGEEQAPEVRDGHRERITEGLREVLRAVPSIKGLFILDRDRVIQYASDSTLIDQGFTTTEIRSALATNQPTYRELEETEDGSTRTRLVVPIYDAPGADDPSGDRPRLGWLFVVYEPDPELVARLPRVGTPSVPLRGVTVTLVVIALVVAMGSLVVTGIGVVPVRRLEGVLRDYRDRGFRGGLKAGRLAERGDLAGTVQAITELGGRLEAMAEHGQEREALLATLSQTLEDGMVAVDPEGVPLAWNPAALRILGYPAESRQSVETDTGLVDAEDTDGVRDETRIRAALGRNPDLFSPSEPGGLADQREMALDVGDGETAAARVTRVPLEVRPGETGTLLLFRDLGALRRIEAHMLEASSYAVLAHLAAGLAHEIRNPLHSIGLNAGVVEQYIGGEWSAERATAVRDSLQSIQDETRRLTDLLNNYLGLVRPADQRDPVDVRDLCERIVRLMSYTAKRSGVRLRLEGDASVPPIEGVADRLQQAILNLVLNAIQAMPDGGTVSLRTEYDDAEVRLTVADTGPGVPESMRDRLFDLGITTKETGTGLGLPLVRLTADSHGGRVSYRFVEGTGSEFTLSLPAGVGAGTVNSQRN